MKEDYMLLDLEGIEKLVALLTKKLKLKKPAISCEKAFDEYNRTNEFVILEKGVLLFDTDNVIHLLDMMYDDVNEKKVDELVPVLLKTF